ncbi:phage portal protein [Arthrobacter pityocampae]|uniref:phage portal protein n=1 Tax=Arthrobacter pityocampae TaxID=547334 RepID=UPI003735D977
MPLPLKSIEWPPAELAAILDNLATYDAWVTGDTNSLTRVYGGTLKRTGGVIGAVNRFFWGRLEENETSTKLHAPLAADICRVNADLLFADPVVAAVAPDTEGAEPDPKTEERLDLITESLHQVNVSAAEMSSAFGGTYLRATWDETASEAPFVTKVDADMAWPTFRWGRLQSVVFWKRLASVNGTVWRHLECHEEDKGVGVIRHGLYQGTDTHLGTPVPFEDRPETAWLAEQELIDENTISTQTPGLDVEYVRNLEQSKLWRKHPIGANLGGSDLEGLLGDLDAYDRAYTSLMQDLEDGKSRLIVSESALQSNGPGKGVSFDEKQRIFTGLHMPPSAATDQKMPIEQVQFKIRVDEHLRIMDDLMHRIIRSAGYSPRSFGIYTEGDKTATEIVSEDELSTRTRKRKIRAFEPALERILAKCLAIDSVVLKGGGKPDARVSVQFAEANKETPLALSQLALNLRNARAASTQTVVALQHPDWGQDEIDAEVARIMEEDGLPPLADPDDRPPSADLTED